MNPGRDGGPPAGVLEGSKPLYGRRRGPRSVRQSGSLREEEGACALRGASRAASGALRHAEQLAQGAAGVGAVRTACPSAPRGAGVRFGALSFSLRNSVIELWKTTR